MKKTIAKMMAAAMMLSAVPAVTLPSFVSKADTITAVTNTTTSTYADQFFGGEAKRAVQTKGEIFTFKMPDGATLDQYSVAPAQATSAVATGVKATLTLDSNNLVHVKVSMDTSKMSNSQKSDFIKAVKEGNNTFKVSITRDVTKGVDTTTTPGKVLVRNVGRTDLQNAYIFDKLDVIDLGQDAFDVNLQGKGKVTDNDRKAILFNQKFKYTSEKTYSIGGVYENGKIKSGVFDGADLLADRNVYANIDKVTSDGMAEVELLKQDKNEANKLKDNDALRGQKLELNTVWISGIEYKVGKLGSQALKEAKMKKIELKNCSKVGKGAMRKCKQLRNVNLKDKNKVRKIHAKAFYDCKNLKNITIDARKLNTVGNESFTKVKKNCRIKLKASKSKFNDCVKKIKKANKKNTTLKFARIAP